MGGQIADGLALARAKKLMAKLLLSAAVDNC